MSRQTSFWVAILILLVAAIIRLFHIASLPPGLNLLEAQDIQIVELVRLGQVEVLYDIGSEGREGLYHVLLSVITAFIGNDPFGYRMLSIWVALLSLALVYSLSRRLYGRVVGLVTMGAMMVPFWSLLLSRTIAREVMLPFLLVTMLTVLSRALPVYRRPLLAPNTLPFALLGLVLGFGFYVHPAHYMIVLVSMVFIGYMILTRQPMSRRTLSYLSFTILILIIVATPYLISSLRLPELNGAARLGGEYELIAEDGVFVTILGNLRGLFWRGDANLLHNLPNRPYMDIFSGIVMMIGVWFAGRRFMQPRYGLMIIALVILLPVALLTPQSPNFMGYSVMMPLLAIFFGLGIKHLYRLIEADSSVTFAFAGGVTVLLLVNLSWSLHGFFVEWGQSDEVKTAYHERVYQLATYLDTTVSGTNTVVCSPVLPSTSPVWMESHTDLSALLALMMDNPDEAQIRYVDCGSGIVFTNGGKHQQLILLEADMYDRLHPYIRQWVEQGDIIMRGVPERSVVSMIVDETLSDTIGVYTTTATTGFAPESPGGAAAALPPINFEEHLTFLGYDQQETLPGEQGDVLTFVTYWRADGDVPNDLKFFTHFLFDAQTRVSQSDTISVMPQRLQTRDVFIQVTFVPIPETIPDGVYQASIGAYRQEDQRQLNVLDNQQPRGTRLFISEIIVQ